MDSLPNEMILKIYDYLEIQDLKNMSLVSSKPYLAKIVIEEKMKNITSEYLKNTILLILKKSLEENRLHKKLEYDVYMILYNFIYNNYTNTWFLKDSELFAFFLYEWICFHRIYKLDNSCDNLHYTIAKNRWDTDYTKKIDDLNVFSENFTRLITSENLKLVMNYVR